MKNLKILLSAALVGALSLSFYTQDKVDANTLNYSITVQSPELAFSVTGTAPENTTNANTVVQNNINGANAVFTDVITASNTGNISTDISAQITKYDLRLAVVGGNPSAANQLSLQMTDNDGSSLGFLNDSTPLKVVTLGTPNDGTGTDSTTLRMDAYLGSETPSSSTPYTFEVTYTAQATPTP